MDFKLNLKINIPSDTCDCDEDCICRKYIKCNNNCFCGNIFSIKQSRSVHAALTPDYRHGNRLKYKLKKKSVSFGCLEIKPISPAIYHSPRYFWVTDMNRKFKNRFLSPQPLSRTKCYRLVDTPRSV